MPTDTSGDYDLIARIHDWLLSLWTDPEAAAQFAESPAVSLAANNLDQDALSQVNLKSIAGGVADAPGLPPGGKAVLNSFANSPGSGGGTREVFHVTREVHHDNPIIQKIFQDNSVTIDNSQTLINQGIIDGDVSLDNNSSLAVGDGAVSASGGSNVNAATGDGSVANQGEGDVNQAGGQAQIIDDSEVGQNSSNSDGSVQVGDDANGAVNTGAVQGTQAGGGATGNVTGDDNETATVGASAGGATQENDEDGEGGDEPENGHFGEGADGGKPEDGQPEGQQGEPGQDGQQEPAPGDAPAKPAENGDQPAEAIDFGQGAGDTPPPADGGGAPDDAAATLPQPAENQAPEIPTVPVTEAPAESAAVPAETDGAPLVKPVDTTPADAPDGDHTDDAVHA